MSYTPINLRMYLAAYSGALAGMNASDRIPKNPNASFYTLNAAVAGAWAASFDTLWNDATDPTVLEVQSVQECSESTWQQRAPQPSVSTLTPSSYDEQTAAIVALIQAADAYMASQGIVPPVDGGGGAVTLLGDVTGPTDANRVGILSGVDDVTTSLAVRFGLNIISDTLTDGNGFTVGVVPSTAGQEGASTQLHAGDAINAGDLQAGDAYLSSGRGYAASGQIDGSLWLGAGDGPQFRPIADPGYRLFFGVGPNNDDQGFKLTALDNAGTPFTWALFNQDGADELFLANIGYRTTLQGSHVDITAASDDLVMGSPTLIDLNSSTVRILADASDMLLRSPTIDFRSADPHGRYYVITPSNEARGFKLSSVDSADGAFTWLFWNDTSTGAPTDTLNIGNDSYPLRLFGSTFLITDGSADTFSMNGGIFALATGAGDTFDTQLTVAGTATAGGGDLTPVSVLGYLEVTINGTPAKIPLYSP